METFTVSLPDVIFVLIETLWNVNNEKYGLKPWTESVLIETLWNVNEVKENEEAHREFVLIETLWNVN